MGCGYGLCAPALSSKFKTVVGVDLSHEMLSRSTALTHRVVAEAGHLPFRGGAFDCAVAMNLFIHLPNPEDALREMSQATKRGGAVMVETMNKRSPLLLLSAAADFAERRMVDRKRLQQPGKRMRYRHYTDGGLAKIAVGAGLRLERRDRYLLVGAQLPRSLARISARIERPVERTPLVKRLTLMSLHTYQVPDGDKT